MKVLIVLALALVAIAAAAPSGSYVYVKEDTLGNYNFDFNAGDHSRSEKRMHTGETEGKYSYMDEEGHLYTITYTAGEGGFRAYGAHIPTPVAPEVENPEVVRARNEHLAVWAKTAAENGIFEEEHARTIKVLVPVH